MNKPLQFQARIKRYWERFWMKFSGMPIVGRFATKTASLFSPPYKARNYLARFNKRGYFSPSASLHCQHLSLGNNIFMGDRVVLYEAPSGGSVVISDRVSIHQDTVIETGEGGHLSIGSDTHIQPRCQLSAYKGSIEMGSNIQIAPACAFYPYDHSFEDASINIRSQPLRTQGGIVIEDDVWLGYGVIVLDGVRIGKGSVIGAGAVVTKNIPPGSIAAGMPARVIKSRDAE